MVLYKMEVNMIRKSFQLYKADKNINLTKNKEIDTIHTNSMYEDKKWQEISIQSKRLKKY